MSLRSPHTYRVVIRHNVVAAIEAIAVQSSQVIDDPLEVSSQLARNNLTRGCMDGDYYFSDAEAARFFAHLSLDFLRKILDRSIGSLDSGAVAGQGWINPHHTANAVAQGVPDDTVGKPGDKDG